MSSPSASLLFAMSLASRALARDAVVAGEELPALLDAEPEREEDLPLGLHAAVVAGLDPVDGRFGDAGLASQLRLRHQRGLSELLNSIHAAPPRAAAVHHSFGFV